MKEKDGEYIGLNWEDKPLAYYVKGHIGTIEACETVAREEEIDPVLLSNFHKYARWVFRQQGTPDGCDFTLKVYPGPGRGRFKVTEVLSKEQWHQQYMDRIMARAGLTEDQAKDVLDAGMGEYDYSECPIYSADEELSYWTD